MPTTWTALLKENDGQFVALCPEVDVASVGATRDEAERNLRDAIDSLVTHLREEGREAELDQRGVSLEDLHEFLLDEDDVECPHRTSVGQTEGIPLGVVAVG